MFDTRLQFVPKERIRASWAVNGVLQRRRVKCGKKCHCATGKKHGAYWYLVWRDGDRLRNRYVAETDLPVVRKALRSGHRWIRRARMMRRRTLAIVKQSRMLVHLEQRNILQNTLEQMGISHRKALLYTLRYSSFLMKTLKAERIVMRGKRYMPVEDGKVAMRSAMTILDAVL